MAISPPSDIVLGVARAVDPSSYQAAAQRLARMGAATPPTNIAAAEKSDSAAVADWTAEVLKQQTAAAGQSQPPGSPLQLASTPRSSTSAVKSSPYTQFESFVLQSFIESMLPQDAESVFGGGIAGQYWKSMMAEKLAEQLAESGSVGIARQLASQNAGAAHGPHPTVPDKTSSALLAPAQPHATETSNNQS